MRIGNVWLYQCNPKGHSENVYSYTPDLLEKECKRGRYLHIDWYCPQHFNDIRVGDLMLLYFAGKKGGIYGLGKITKVRAAGRKDSTVSHRLDKRVTDHLRRNPIPGKAVYALGLIKSQRQTIHDVTEEWHRMVATLSIISSIFR
jgi:hypothetical protein